MNIALAKKSKVVVGSEMPPFFAAKLKAFTKQLIQGRGGSPIEQIVLAAGINKAIENGNLHRTNLTRTKLAFLEKFA